MPEPKQLDLREVGIAQRLTMWGFLAAIVGNIIVGKTMWGYFAAIARNIIKIDSFITPVLLLLIALFLCYCVYRLARSLRLNIIVSVIYVLLVIIPIIGILALYNLTNKATIILRAKGIRVGIMGPSVKDLPNTDTSPIA